MCALTLLSVLMCCPADSRCEGRETRATQNSRADRAGGGQSSYGMSH